MSYFSFPEPVDLPPEVESPLIPPTTAPAPADKKPKSNSGPSQEQRRIPESTREPSLPPDPGPSKKSKSNSKRVPKQVPNPYQYRLRANPSRGQRIAENRRRAHACKDEIGGQGKIEELEGWGWCVLM